jgi:dihydroorotase
MKTLLKNATIVNENKIIVGSVIIKNDIIEDIIFEGIESINEDNFDIVIDAKNQWLLPGAIDDQVHFREPGLTHKGTIYAEAKAAVAGGITSFMEMPNTVPNAVTQDLLQDKYRIAQESSLANFSFYMGTTNNNIDEVLATDIKNVCGIKIFMGSSTGNMLVDNEQTLETVFKKSKLIIATHCEDETTIHNNVHLFKMRNQLNILNHHLIRSQEACYKSSSFAVSLAKKYGTKLHVLHISTAQELQLFSSNTALSNKHITAEACIHHLCFTNEEYSSKGNFIKWNPAVKTQNDQDALWQALHNNSIDVIATDHAPHTIEEKNQSYDLAPSGGPLVQHAILAMLEKVDEGKISIELMVNKMSHSVAQLFQVSKRGYIRKGYFADLVLVDRGKENLVSKDSLYYKCNWSPFENHKFKNTITHTFVNGHLAYCNGVFNESIKGRQLVFER